MYSGMSFKIYSLCRKPNKEQTTWYRGRCQNAQSLAVAKMLQHSTAEYSFSYISWLQPVNFDISPNVHGYGAF